MEILFNKVVCLGERLIVLRSNLVTKNPFKQDKQGKQGRRQARQARLGTASKSERNKDDE